MVRHQAMFQLASPMPTPSVFAVPRDGAMYTTQVFDRCRDLIRVGIWSGLPLHRLDAWINNFHTSEEQYFAACMLDALIYRSADQTVALIKQLFQRAIPDFARQRNTHVPLLGDIYHLLQRPNANPRLRLVPVLRPSHNLAKSGPTIARLLRRSCRFSDDWIINPEQIGHVPCDVLICVDDFLGTGDQFSRFFAERGLATVLPNTLVIYAPLVACQSSFASLALRCPGVAIVPAETLGAKQDLFNADAGFFDDGVNNNDLAREFYYGILTTRGFALSGTNRLGFGGLAVLYAFEHAVPDDSIPLLWWPNRNQWHSLFDR